MYCIKCGSQINESDKICRNCGSVVEQATSNIVVQQESNKDVKKEKLKWWIPVILFFAGVTFSIINVIIKFALYDNEELLLKLKPLTLLLSALYIICLLLVLPSIIYIIILYKKK